MVYQVCRGRTAGAREDVSVWHRDAGLAIRTRAIGVMIGDAFVMPPCKIYIVCQSTLEVVFGAF